MRGEVCETFFQKTMARKMKNEAADVFDEVVAQATPRPKLHTVRRENETIIAYVKINSLH